MTGPGGQVFQLAATDDVPPEKVKAELRKRIGAYLESQGGTPTTPTPVAVPTVAPAADEEQGNFLTRALKRGVPATQSGLATVIEDLPNSLQGLTGESAKYLREAAQAREEELGPRKFKGVFEEEGFGRKIGSLAETVAESSIPTLAGIVTGAVTRSPVAAGAVMFGGSAPVTYGGIRERQKTEGIDDIGRAVVGTAVSSALDILTGVGGKVLSTTAALAARKVLERGLKQAVIRVSKTAGVESGTEILQNIIEQVAGGTDPTTKRSMLETLEAGLAGAFGGTVFSGAKEAVVAPFRPKVGELGAGNKETQLRASRELARQVRSASIDLDEESIGATYSALVNKYVADGMPMDQAMIKASRSLPSIIGVSADDLGGIDTSGGTPAAAPTVSVANVNAPEANTTGATILRVPPQAVTPEKVAEVLPAIDAEFATYVDDIEAEYGVTELTPETRNAVAELIVSSPEIAPIDAIGSILRSAERAAATPATASVAPTVDMLAPTASVVNPVEITPAPALDTAGTTPTIDMAAPLKQRTVAAQQLVVDTVANDPTLAGLEITDRQQAMAKNQLANGRQPDAATAINAVLNKTQLAAIAAQPAMEAPAPAVVPAPPSVDEVAVAPVVEAIEQAAAPTGSVVPSLAETAARDVGITETPTAPEVTVEETAVTEPVAEETAVTEPVAEETIQETTPGVAVEETAVTEPVAEETIQETTPEVAVEETAVTEPVAEDEEAAFNGALEAVEDAYWAEDDNGNPLPEIDEKTYNLLISAAEGKRGTPEKILAALERARSRFSEEQFNQRYRPGTENAGIPLADAQAAVGAVSKGIGASPNVVQSFSDLPIEARQQAEADGATDAAGITTPDGRVHLIADQLADAADAVATLYHEVLGHVGLSRLFRSRLDTRLKEMYRGNKKLRDDTDAFIAENPDAYPNDPDPLARAVEEILAKRSEAGKIEASLLAKITGVIKDVGRRIGIKSNFSDAEVGAILSRAHDMAINGTQEGETGQRYARKKKTGPGKAVTRAEKMLADSHNPSATNQATSIIMSIERSVRRSRHLMRIIPANITIKRGRIMLQFITPINVVRLAKRQSNALGTRLDKVALAMTEMRNTRSAMQVKVQASAYRWNKFNGRFKEGGKLLSDMMNLSTLYDIDPRLATNVRDFIAQDEKIKAVIADSKLGQRAKNNRIKDRTELAEAVYKRWDALANPANGNGEGRKIFDMAAKAYRETFDRQLSTMLNRINNSTLSPTRKVAATTQLKAMFAEAEKIGLYFPLGREGDYWMRFGTGKDRGYFQFASKVERDLVLSERYDGMVERGERRLYDDVINSGELSFGDNANTLQSDVVENDPTNILQKMLNELDAGNIGDLKAVKEQLTEMYLQTMPKTMQAAAMRRRQGVTGFTANTLRSFVVTQSAAASRLARLEHADTIRNNLGRAYAIIQNDPDKDRLSPYVDQMAEFAGRQLAPTKGDPWAEFIATGLNRATFLYMMTSLKTAIIQPLQLSTVGITLLIRDYGVGAPALAFRNMTRFYKLLGVSKLDEDGNVITNWGQPSMNDGGYINDNPNPEMRTFLKGLWSGGNDRGMFSTNYTGDIVGDAQVDTGVFNNVVLESGRKTLNFVHNFMTGAGFHTERLSREIMFMSAGELEYKKLRKAGVSEADAAKRAEQKAAELTLEGLFDYEVDSKPMVARGPLGRVVFQFATFPMNMSSLLIRSFYNAVSLKSTSKERRDASIMFFGTMASTFMWAGATGLPLYTTFMGLADVARELFRPLLEDDDEDPGMYNAESGNPMAYASMDLWFRQWFLPNMLGGGVAQRALEMGPISAYTDINFESSMSLNNMFFRDEQPAKNVADAVQNLIMSAGLGASGGMAKQISQGIDFMLAGDGQRAAEKLMPYNFLRQPLIAKRLQEEGYITSKNVELKSEEFYTVGKLFAQNIGFGSTEVAEIQKRNILFSRAEDKIDTIRSKVQRGYAEAYLKYLSKPTPENETAYEKATERWDEYNMEYGLIKPITGPQMKQSVVSRAEDRAVAGDIGGIQTDKNMRVLAQDMLAQGQ